MSERSFLNEWDEAIRDARQLGREQFIWRAWISEDGAYNLRRVAKTMHPSFMAAVPPKYDPKRDQYQNVTDRDRTNGHGAR
jgi:hypothetical protein